MSMWYWNLPVYPEFEKPTAPVFPVGIVTWSALGRAVETGTLSWMTDMPAPLIAAQAFSAALVPANPI